MEHLLRITAAALAVAASACGAPEIDKRESPPFEVTVGSTRLAVPDRPDLYRASLHNFAQGPTVIIRVCNREAGAGTYEPVVAGCDGMESPLVNRYGISTHIWHDEGAKYQLLSERPNLEAPGRNALDVISPDQIDTDIRGDGEAYQLTRVSLLRGPLQTTDNGWPVASCGLSYSGAHQCGIGFLVNDVFVEAHWTAEDGVALTQAEVWSVSTALDATIRSLITTSELPAL